jgi:WD40 repeat protein/ABC-type dipeptide/oligopeptide/nickel transport system ATPase component
MVDEKVIANPFPGLRAFEEDEDILFFGREKQIDELLKKLRKSRFLAIIGSSGSGKSSLVKSGLLPSLHSGLMSGVGSDWKIALFRPGNDPIGRMNEAMSQDGILREYDSEEDHQIYSAINESILRRSNLGLVELYRQSGMDTRNNLLVLVDQFEELFRFSKYEREEGDGKRDSIAFINLLLKATEQKEFPIYVVFTMRSDFLGDCTEFRGLPEAINEGQYLVPRMTRDERREAITGPIAVGHGAITPALLNRLLNDVGDNPDQLPILQHAMMRTWDEWKQKHHPEQPIDIDDYEQIGTISEALSQHAEEAYAELQTDRERFICERMFKELTDKSSLTYGVRRPRQVKELCAAADATREEVVKVIEVFRKTGRGFLMPAAPTALDDNTIVDISHESLMRVWKRLITWLDEEDESAQVYLHLCDAVNLYEAGKGGLWRDPELQVALKWKEEQNTNAAWASRYNNFYDKVMFFLEHSRQQRDLEIKHKEELQKQRLRITRRVSVVVSVIAFIACILAVYSSELSTVANKEKQKAIVAATNAKMQKHLADSSALVARDEKATALTEKAKAELNARIALHQDSIAKKEELIAKRESYNAHIAEADAKQKAQEANDNMILANNNAVRADSEQKKAERSQLRAVKEAAESRRLERLAESRTNAHKAELYINDKEYQQCLNFAVDAYDTNKANNGSFQDNDIYSALYLSWASSLVDRNEATFHSAPVRALAVMPAGDVVYSGDEDGKIIGSKVTDGILSKLSEANLGRGVRALAISPDGNYLLAVSQQNALLYTIGKDKFLTKRTVINYPGIGRHATFLDKTRFVVLSSQGVARFDLAAPKAGGDLITIPDCSAMAVGSDGMIYIAAGKKISGYKNWEQIRGKSSVTFTLSAPVTAVNIDASGRFLAAGTYEGTIWVKDLKNDDKPFSSPLHHSSVNDIQFAQVAGNVLQLSSASSDRTVKLTEIDLGPGTVNNSDVVTLDKHTSWVYALSYLPGTYAHYLLSASEDHLVITWPTTMADMYTVLKPKKK